ncbi:hypothetical protein ABK040_009760 [Willaertia magna]
MSKTNRQPSRCVFIGNIAYDASLEKLKAIFSEVGPIVNFRMVYDRETNKPKGYAFCEYSDEASALSAMRNLDGRELNNRKLRVDFADNPPTLGGATNDPRFAGMDAPVNVPTTVGGFDSIPQTSSTSDLQVGGDPVMDALNQLPKAQLYECLVEMKELIKTNPEQARRILSQNPTLAIVLLHIQYILGMVNQPYITSTITSAPPLITPTNMQAPMTTPPMNPSMPPTMSTMQQPTMINDPRRQLQQQQAPVQPDISQLLNAMTEDQIMQIINLDEQQLLGIPPEQQEQIRLIKQHLSTQFGGRRV